MMATGLFNLTLSTRGRLVVALSVLAFFLTRKLMQHAGDIIPKAMWGNDIGKRTRPLIPEGCGILSGGITLLCVIVSMPLYADPKRPLNKESAPMFAQYSTAVLSLTLGMVCMYLSLYVCVYLIFSLTLSSYLTCSYFFQRRLRSLARFFHLTLF